MSDIPKTFARASALGRYVVLGLIGRGAMGDVYAAYDPELDRKVAIKLLRVSHGGGQSLADGRKRLIREAQAIAKLSHPNVVVVHDVGTIGDQVFVTMEYVDGHTLRYWLEADTRTWSDVLKVFLDAGYGLAAAHEKDLVHRDFKPDNVMFGFDGQVRVMDFGLARIVNDPKDRTASDVTEPGFEVSGAIAHLAASGADLDSTMAIGSPPAIIRSEARGEARGEARSEAPAPEDGHDLHLTQTGDAMGTPAYMSPEQFRGMKAGAATDQFSFCVALYEALYGERPFLGKTMNELSANVLRGMVRDPAPHRDVPAWIRAIVLRGLSVDPRDRWPSMKALLAELENDGVMAGRDRFAAGAAARLIGIWEPLPSQEAAEPRSRSRVREAFLATQKRYAGVAYATVSKMLDEFATRWTDMYIDACEATHVRGDQSAEVLDLRMAFLNDRLRELKALCEMFRHADAEVVENAVSAVGSLGRLDRGNDIKLLRAIVKPPEDPATQRAVESLRTRLAEARVMWQVGRLLDGVRALEPLGQEARAIGYVPLLAEVLLETGKVLCERRDADKAARVLEEAVWTAELCRHDEAAAEAATFLVYVVGDTQSRFDAGGIWARHAEMLLSRMGGHDYLWGWLYNNRGAMRERQGLLSEALEDARRAVKAKENAQGPDSPDVAMSLSNMALAFDQMGESEIAVHQAQRAADTVEARLGSDHPRTGVLRSNYAEILNHVGRFAEARQMAERALVALEGESEADGLILSYPLMALGVALLGEGRPAEATPVLERAVTIRGGKESQASRRGEARFALARALWAAERDRARAGELARTARSEYLAWPLAPGGEKEAERIDAWLLSLDGAA